MNQYQELHIRISKIFYFLRRKLDLSQADFARDIGTTQPKISKIESFEQSPNLVTWFTFCEVYGIPVDLPFNTKAYNAFIKD